MGENNDIKQFIVRMEKYANAGTSPTPLLSRDEREKLRSKGDQSSLERLNAYEENPYRGNAIGGVLGVTEGLLSMVPDSDEKTKLIANINDIRDQVSPTLQNGGSLAEDQVKEIQKLVKESLAHIRSYL